MEGVIVCVIVVSRICADAQVFTHPDPIHEIFPDSKVLVGSL
jgi:hypothetical protein